MDLLVNNGWLLDLRVGHTQFVLWSCISRIGFSFGWLLKGQLFTHAGSTFVTASHAHIRTDRATTSGNGPSGSTLIGLAPSRSFPKSACCFVSIWANNFAASVIIAWLVIGLGQSLLSQLNLVSEVWIALGKIANVSAAIHHGAVVLHPESVSDCRETHAAVPTQEIHCDLSSLAEWHPSPS